MSNFQVLQMAYLKEVNHLIDNRSYHHLGKWWIPSYHIWFCLALSAPFSRYEYVPRVQMPARHSGLAGQVCLGWQGRGFLIWFVEYIVLVYPGTMDLEERMRERRMSGFVEGYGEQSQHLPDKFFYFFSTARISWNSNIYLWLRVMKSAVSIAATTAAKRHNPHAAVYILLYLAADLTDIQYHYAWTSI